MARTEWVDIEQNQTLDNAALAEARGGWFPQTALNPAWSFLGRNLQNATDPRSRSQPFRKQHNNFISFIRS